MSVNKKFAGGLFAIGLIFLLGGFYMGFDQMKSDEIAVMAGCFIFGLAFFFGGPGE